MGGDTQEGPQEVYAVRCKVDELSRIMFENARTHEMGDAS